MCISSTTQYFIRIYVKNETNIFISIFIFYNLYIFFIFIYLSNFYNIKKILETLGIKDSDHTFKVRLYIFFQCIVLLM
jgi:hypothetical protein